MSQLTVSQGELNELKGGQAHLLNSYHVPFAVLGALYSLSYFKVDENMRHIVLFFSLRCLRTKSLAGISSQKCPGVGGRGREKRCFRFGEKLFFFFN